MDKLDDYTKVVNFLAKSRALQDLEGDYTSLYSRYYIRGFTKGYIIGFRQRCKQEVIEFFSNTFPHESTACLENLTIGQYVEIFDSLVECKGLEEIIKIIAN